MSGDTAYDAVVAGGGLAGGLAALALARLGLGVAMIEAGGPERPARTADGRSISLSLASMRVLESLGVGATLAEASRPITTVHVSESGRFGVLRLTAREMGVPALGHVVPAEALLAGIEGGAVAAGVTRIAPARVEAAPLADAARAITAATPDGRRVLRARLLVVADGAGSQLRTALGVRARERRYGADALVTAAGVSRAQPGVAYERFTAEGTLAILPRPGERVGIVWALPAARAAEFAALAPEAFLERVRGALGGRLGTLHDAAPLRRFPLIETRALAQTAERAVIIGNAAHALHPVAAQGFNLTVRDVAALAECVGGERADPGAAAVLARYAHGRRRDQARTRAFTGAVRTLGDLHLPAAAPARAAGLFALEFVRPLARQLARQGMGLAPRPLPALVRGSRL